MPFSDLIKCPFNQARWWMPVNFFSAPAKDLVDPDLPLLQNQELKRLEKLAVQQKFTSEIRKKIFIIIMSADDYVDATQRLLKMKINKSQLREIAVVIVGSCAQELVFNKYYGVLAENLINMNNKLKFSFQYSFWDHFKQIDNYSLRKVANLAKLMYYLLERQVFGFAALRGMDMEALNAHQKIFLQIVMKLIFKNLNLGQIKEMVTKLNSSDEFAMFREGLAEFIKNEVLKPLRQEGDEKEDVEEIKGKIKSVLHYLKLF